MKRAKHSLSHYNLFTGNMGELIPIACYEALPGDSIQQATSLLMRVSPQVLPVMHPVSVRVHTFFVPNRLLWDGWETFITGGSNGLGDGAAFPYVTTPASTGFVEGSLADYLGVTPGVPSFQVSALPFRAYAMIFNEWYRDEDLVTAVPMVKTSGADSTTGVALKNVAWEKDYFTSARPWPQKGPDVTLPLGTSATVRTSSSQLVTGAQASMTFRDKTSGGVGGASQGVSVAGTTGEVFRSGTAGGSYVDGQYPSNLYADLEDATAVDINTVREAFALQRYQEARARYGSRYTEYLRYLGVQSSDARLQRPEYLGGGKQTISFSEVVQTGTNTFDGDEENLGVGNLSGHGIAATRTRRFRRFFEEHGIVMSLLSVRPRTMYPQGLGRMWTRRTKEDYWQKELELIGQQEVLNQEIYMADSAPTDVFGYQDRYAEYRHIQSRVSGEMRSVLDAFHMARIFSGDQTLNSTFVTCDPTTRIYQVATNDVLWCMASHSIQARRMVTRNPFPRIL